MVKLDILFWNIKNRGQLGQIKPAIKDLYRKYKPKVFLLIETDLTDDETEQLFDGELKSVMSSVDKTVRLFAHTSLIMKEINDKDIPFPDGSTQINNRVVTFKLIYGKQSILFFGTHFPSKFSYNDPSQYKIMRKWQDYIDSQEKLQKTDKSIFFGDLNLNPFDSALYQDDSLHAHPVISEHTSYKPMFYNPMWSLMGDYIYKSNKSKVPGSYYFKPSSDSVGEYHWNCLDGVLIKRNLVSK
jgi:hypothetical protein